MSTSRSWKFYPGAPQKIHRPSLGRRQVALQLEIARRIVYTMFRLAAVPTIEANMIAAVRFAENAGFHPPIADVTNAMALGTAFRQNRRAADIPTH